MEVVPTNDGDDDDGVIWYRCPQCQGFLPKLKGSLDGEEETESSAEVAVETTESKEDSLRWDSPADMMEELNSSSGGNQGEKENPLVPDSATDLDDEALLGVDSGDSLFEPKEESSGSEEPAVEDQSEPSEEGDSILEFAAMLAESDVAEAVPYRPWDVFEVGQCINHLAWNDCGVVVAKEELPGGRKIIKCYFETAGVIRLIEEAPR